MTPPSATELAAHADAAAALIGLPLDPAHRPGVLNYLALAARMAVQVHAVPLDAHDESALVFRPVGPADVPSGDGT